ncbi:NAD/NADP-dependent octopine/nopaline dehydrogenase family protein [Desulfohalobium retbaense]|uniref:NAD/NADP octopine/nopaline dehydrogenase n=1 Tax=Desulfohalobium retbaense (strain ATCC 49708 / DSM 5692 / JCM 16813 / HR100) TaxID=485915 RepID=C8WZA2_DESRD|nr:NAD/NADP-dependent octopine/nopaline dehydrogenase family protein [Desulfohalobium retbaense]ACV67377.1 NAD/NADP octopine/nopaline dehydrogenase [Desulfohalobium retbaense DSM 5692]
MSRETVWAIVGGGNGGQSLAGHLSLMGYPVRLYDIFTETVDAINAQGGIEVSGVVEGFGKPELVTTDLGAAVKGADAVMIVAPAVAHKTIAKQCAPYVSAGQTYILHPGATCGALEFRHTLDECNCTPDLAVAETNSLIYACRAPKPGHAVIHGIKDDLVLSTLPAAKNEHVLGVLQEAFPQIVGGANVMQSSLGNANAIMHPAPTLLNTSLIESRHDWYYYREGITPSIGAFVEELDKERVNLAQAFGLDMITIREWYRVAYGVEAETLSEAVKKNPAYAEIRGQKELRTRYLLEDIPTGLVPMIEMGKLMGVDTPRMELVARFGSSLLEEDFFAKGRTLKNLGLAGMGKDDFLQYLQTGVKA